MKKILLGLIIGLIIGSSVSVFALDKFDIIRLDAYGNWQAVLVGSQSTGPILDIGCLEKDETDVHKMSDLERVTIHADELRLKGEKVLTESQVKELILELTK